MGCLTGNNCLVRDLISVLLSADMSHNSVLKLLQDRDVDTDINELATLITELFISKDTVGGVYCVKINSIKGLPISFKFKNKNNKFENDDDFVLLKIGRTDNYKARFASFGMDTEVIFKVNGDNNMEKWCKGAMPANFMKYFMPARLSRTLRPT